MKNLCNTLPGSVLLGVLLLLLPAAESAGAKEKTVYWFSGGYEDGSSPEAGLILTNGLLYGTTSGGGGYNVGTVFSLDPATWTETVVYTFCQQPYCADGSSPEAGLIDVNGILYGTTWGGGAGTDTDCETYGCGAVFSLDPSTGSETVLHSFCSQQNCTDGKRPQNSLIDVNGTLYGTTFSGGTNAEGTVFALDPNTGTETVIYSFCNRQNCKDGAAPTNLIQVKGMLYGTTFAGGYDNDGIAFALDPVTGAETVLHTFGGVGDGTEPEAGLNSLNGTLYGTTAYGGAHQEGTVFSLDPKTRTETVLYSFCGCGDGAVPRAGLTEVGGVLYGTTSESGVHHDGTVFALDPKTGTETVLYSFCSRSHGRHTCLDGGNPVAGLTKRKGRLYGSTLNGGRGGAGVVFSVGIP